MHLKQGVIWNKVFVPFPQYTVSSQFLLGVTFHVFLQYSSRIDDVNGNAGNISVTPFEDPSMLICVHAYDIANKIIVTFHEF